VRPAAAGRAHDKAGGAVAEVRQEPGGDDALLTRIGQTVMLHRGGDREEARHRLLRLWTALGAEGAPLHRCVVAHFTAGTQDDTADALAWDLRALSAAREAAARSVPPPPAVRALLPALHLGLAADYARLGRGEAARGHTRLARRAAAVLGDDGYGVRTRAALARLERDLGVGGAAGPDHGSGTEPGDGGPAIP
jgi:hypothetical protein